MDTSFVLISGSKLRMLATAKQNLSFTVGPNDTKIYMIVRSGQRRDNILTVNIYSDEMLEKAIHPVTLNINPNTGIRISEDENQKISITYNIGTEDERIADLIPEVI